MTERSQGGNESRPQWMNRKGRELYTAWTATVITDCSTTSFFGELAYLYRESMELDASPGEPEGYKPGNAKGDTLVRFLVGNMKRRMRVHHDTDMLMESSDEILHYTSAGAPFFATYTIPTDTSNKNIHPLLIDAQKKANDQVRAVAAKVKVIDHAVEGVEFAMNMAYHLARDFAIQEEGKWKDHEDYPPPGETNNFWAITTERIETIADILEDPDFGICLGIFRETGFDVLTSNFSIDPRLPKQFGSTHAKKRAEFVGMHDEYDQKEIYSLLYRNEEGRISIRPKVVKFLHDKLRQQNTEGLTDSTKKSAG